MVFFASNLTVIICLCCTRQSRAPSIDRCAQTFDLDIDLWHWPLHLKQGKSDVKTQFLAFDLDLWPTTLTYNPSLAKVKVDPNTKNQGQRSNGSAVRALTNKHTNGLTDGRTLPSALSPCFAVDKNNPRSIIVLVYNCHDPFRWRTVLSFHFKQQKSNLTCFSSMKKLITCGMAELKPELERNSSKLF